MILLPSWTVRLQTGSALPLTAQVLCPACCWALRNCSVGVHPLPSLQPGLSGGLDDASLYFSRQQGKRPKMPDSSGFKRLDLRGLQPGRGTSAIPWPPGPPVSCGCLSRASLEPWEQGCHLDQDGRYRPIDRSACKASARIIDSVFVETEQAGKEA